MPDIPRSAVEELANFCDVSSSHELRTNPPAIDGSAKSWNAGGVATSPEGRCAGSYAWRAWWRVSPAPRPTTTVPAADREGRPDLIERNFTADAPARKLVGDITYIHTREGFVHLATVVDCYSKGIVGYAMAEHMRTELGKNALQNWRFGTASPSRV